MAAKINIFHGHRHLATVLELTDWQGMIPPEYLVGGVDRLDNPNEADYYKTVHYDAMGQETQVHYFVHGSHAFRSRTDLRTAVYCNGVFVHDVKEFGDALKPIPKQYLDEYNYRLTLGEGWPKPTPETVSHYQLVTYKVKEDGTTEPINELYLYDLRDGGNRKLPFTTEQLPFGDFGTVEVVRHNAYPNFSVQLVELGRDVHAMNALKAEIDNAKPQQIKKVDGLLTYFRFLDHPKGKILPETWEMLYLFTKQLKPQTFKTMYFVSHRDLGVRETPHWQEVMDSIPHAYIPASSPFWQQYTRTPDTEDDDYFRIRYQDEQGHEKVIGTYFLHPGRNGQKDHDFNQNRSFAFGSGLAFTQEFYPTFQDAYEALPKHYNPVTFLPQSNHVFNIHGDNWKAPDEALSITSYSGLFSHADDYVIHWYLPGIKREASLHDHTQWRMDRNGRELNTFHSYAVAKSIVPNGLTSASSIEADPNWEDKNFKAFDHYTMKHSRDGETWEESVSWVDLGPWEDSKLEKVFNRTVRLFQDDKPAEQGLTLAQAMKLIPEGYQEMTDISIMLGIGPEGIRTLLEQQNSFHKFEIHFEPTGNDEAEGILKILTYLPVPKV